MRRKAFWVRLFSLALVICCLSACTPRKSEEKAAQPQESEIDSSGYTTLPGSDEQSPVQDTNIELPEIEIPVTSSEPEPHDESDMVNPDESAPVSAEPSEDTSASEPIQTPEPLEEKSDSTIEENGAILLPEIP